MGSCIHCLVYRFYYKSNCEKIVESIKIIYFTIFYTAIEHPIDITEDIRDELTHYLTSVSGEEIEATKSPEQFIDPKVGQLIPIVQQYKLQGYTDDKISSLLIEKGWMEETIKEAIDRV